MTNEEAMTVLRGLLDRAKTHHTTKRAKMQRILDAGKTPSASMRVDVERAEYTVQQATAAIGHLYALLEAPAAEAVHWCGYECERPACIRAQRDELRVRLEALTAEGVQAGEVAAWQRSIELRPGHWGEWAEYTDLYGEGRPEKVGRFNCRYRPLYTASALSQPETKAEARGVVDEAMARRFTDALPALYAHDAPPISAVMLGLTAALTGERNG